MVKEAQKVNRSRQPPNITIPVVTGNLAEPAPARRPNYLAIIVIGLVVFVAAMSCIASIAIH
jgi:hypothetical protein